MIEARSLVPSLSTPAFMLLAYCKQYKHGQKLSVKVAKSQSRETYKPKARGKTSNYTRGIHSRELVVQATCDIVFALIVNYQTVPITLLSFLRRNYSCQATPMCGCILASKALCIIS